MFPGEGRGHLSVEADMRDSDLSNNITLAILSAVTLIMLRC